MREDRPGSGQRSWTERLSRVLPGKPRDRGQLVQLLRDAQRRDLLDSDALAMIEGVLQVSELRVRDVMIPRAQMAVVQRNQQLEEFLPLIIKTAHSRFPVIGDDKGEVVGLLLAKDLLSYCFQDKSKPFNMREILRRAVFIPESKRLNVLLKEFRASRNHMAIVVNEYGDADGLVTIEDVLEQIVGEIEDEHDIDDGAYIRRRNGQEYTVKALTLIEDFNEYFDSDFSDEEFDTIGGLVTSQLGHLPRRGEVLDMGRFRFAVLRADNRRVHLLNLYLPAEPEYVVGGEKTNKE